MSSKERLIWILGYLEAQEFAHFEEWVLSGNDPVKHIYWEVLCLKNEMLGGPNPEEFVNSLKKAA